MQISDNPHIQESYEQMRRAGQSHAIAEMLALQQPPADKADRTFLAGLAPRAAEENRRLARKAERQGVSVSGATYLKSLARYNGDPEAFIRSRDDVKRVLEKRGWSTLGDGGMVTVKPAPVDVETTPVSAKKYRCDKRLVVEDIQRQVEKNPALGTEIKHNKKFAKDFFHKNHLRLSGQG